MYHVRVTGWSHGKPHTVLLLNGSDFDTVGEANDAARGWEATMHKRHPKTAARYTATVVPTEPPPTSYKVYRDGKWVSVREVTRDGQTVRVTDDGTPFSS
jgi:hypothetical protein